MSTDGINYSDQGWSDVPTDLEPPIRGAVSCDVAVIGGGYAGLSTALRLAERGADVVLLESDYCGSGASSRNAGQLGSVPGGDAKLLKLLHPRRFQGMVDLAGHAAKFTEKLMADLGIDAHYEQVGNFGGALTPGQLKLAKGKADLLASAGGDAEYVEGPGLGIPDTFLGGLREHEGGVLDPGRFALGLRREAMDSGVRVFESSRVRSVDPVSGGVNVVTTGGHVRADRVVLATNAWSGALDIAPKRLGAPVYVTMVETAPIEEGRIEATGWTSRCGLVTSHQIIQNFRISKRNSIVTGVRMLEGPRSGIVARKPTRRVVADIATGFREAFPSLSDVPVEKAWGGWISMAAGMMPVVGEVHPRVSYIVACNGHGLAQSPYLGSLLGDHLSGDQQHPDLATVWRNQPRFAPGVLFSTPVMKASWKADRWMDRRAARS